MRYALTVAAVAGALALGLGTSGARGRPEPVTCPPDVGTALVEMCPCDGTVQPDQSVQPWRNHGAYVRCVVRYRNALRRAGCLDAAARRTIARCAARSTCGKPSAVVCCVYEPGTCTGDPLPGDLVAEGTCADVEPAVACDGDADCTTGTARLARDEAVCFERGGTAVGTGSVCGACPPPPAP